jgi:hypothetical protein
MSKALNRSFTMRIHLDELFSRKTTNTKKHWAGTTFKSFAVIGSSHKVFSLKIVPDPVNSKITAIPLRLGYFQNFETIVNDACFENTAEQPGRWVDVIFFVEDRIDSNPWVTETESSVVEMGHAKGQLDGLTRQILISYNNAQGTVRALDFSDPQFNVGELTINTLNRTDHFVIPPGFIGEVIGCSLIVKTVIAAGNINLYAVEEGSVITEANISSDDKIGYVFNNTDAAGTYDVRVLNTATSGQKGYERRGVILNAGEIPVLASDTGAIPASGDAGVYLMIRLKAI